MIWRCGNNQTECDAVTFT